MSVKVVDNYCLGCEYLGYAYGYGGAPRYFTLGRCCDYLYKTGDLRGCPAGEGCNKFKERESESVTTCVFR